MQCRHHNLEQPVRKLRESDLLLGDDTPLTEVSKFSEGEKAPGRRWRPQ